MTIIKKLIEEAAIYYRRYKGPHNKVSAKEALRLWFKAFKLIVFKSQVKPSSVTEIVNETALSYFRNNNDKNNLVKKATFAWANPGTCNAHFFEASHFEKDPRVCSPVFRADKCKWCGRTREEVRYDALPYYCEKVPDVIEHIKDTLFAEEEKTFKLIARAEKEVPKILQKMGMSGKTLMYMHETHGFVIEIVEALMDISKEVKAEYEIEYELAQNKSRADRQIKKKVVNASPSLEMQKPLTKVVSNNS